MSKEREIYLTKQGLEKIKKEYKKLRKIKQNRTSKESPRFLSSEDLNVEYISFQQDLEFLETRLLELERILKTAQLIKIPPKDKQNIISLGAKVLVEVERQTDEFEIVGTLEADPSIGRLSNESPVGKALLGHKVGDEVTVSSSIKTVYKIKRIKYPLK